MAKSHRKAPHIAPDSCTWADPWPSGLEPAPEGHNDETSERCARCSVMRRHHQPKHRATLHVGYCTYHETTHYDGHESGVCRVIVKVLS